MLSEPTAILTITPNPSLDITTSVPNVQPDRKLRCALPTSEAGGGGINVARVARRLGADVAAVFPLGGPVGHTVKSRLAIEGVTHIGVPVDGETRMSFTVEDRTSLSQYRYVLPGPELTRSELDDLISASVRALPGRSCVVISGSLPAGAPGTFVTELASALQAEQADAQVSLIIDTSGDALAAALQCPGAIVKPSVRELEQIVGRPLNDQAQVVGAAAAVLERSPCRALVVSIGPGGVFIVENGEETIRLRAPTVKVRSAVGAGDSLVAGIAVGINRGDSLEEATRLGVAAGTAAVLTEGTALCHEADVARLLLLVE